MLDNNWLGTHKIKRKSVGFLSFYLSKQINLNLHCECSKVASCATS